MDRVASLYQLCTLINWKIGVCNGNGRRGKRLRRRMNESDGVKTEGKRIERGREPVADLDNLGAPIIIKHEERDIGEKKKKFRLYYRISL